MVPSPRHAWTLRSLLCGKPINGELEELLPPFQAIGHRLATLRLEDRQAAWEAFLDGQVDRDGIILAVAATDPEGPQPEAEEGDEAADDWGPIRLGTLPPAEPFPLDVLPLPARDLAVATAQSIGCPVDFPAVAILAAASGLIGRSASLLVKPGYSESASLWVVLVGGPSSGKTPAIGQALAPMREIASELYERWRVEMDDWEALPEKDRGHAPILRRITTSDPTTEALAPILAFNPRGVTITPDEMTKWVMLMDQYKGGRGGDRPFFMSVWSGQAVIIDRAKFMREPIMVPHPFLSVVGGMTPDMLGVLAEGKGREDGFTARLLFTCPDRVRRPYTEEGVPEDVSRRWNDLARALWQRPMREEDGPAAPHEVRMTASSREEWARWCQTHREEQEADDFPDSLEGSWGKLEAYAARLALVLHLMGLAADPTHPTQAEPPELPRSIIVAATRLVTYFKSHVRRIRAAAGGKTNDGGEDVRALIGWIIRNDLIEFSIRDIGKNFDRFKQDGAALVDALTWMTGRNLVRPRSEPKDAIQRPGRKPSRRFEANPALWESPRFRQFRHNGPVATNSDGNDGNAVSSEGAE